MDDGLEGWKDGYMFRCSDVQMNKRMAWCDGWME